MKIPIFILVVLPFGALPAWCAPGLVGIQAGEILPTNAGLRSTSGPGAYLGVHLSLPLAGPASRHQLRPRAEYARFHGKDRTASDALLQQDIDTRVASWSLGIEYLYQPIAPLPWRLGLAVQEIRWSVASDNTLNPAPGGRLVVSGTTSGWRGGLGPVTTYSFNDHLEAELRVVLSRYGQEDGAANTAAIGLLWHF